MADGTIDITDTTLLSTAAKQDVEHADLVAILAKLSADPATQTTLAAVLAKLIASPSTEAKQDVGNAVLASILSKIIAAPATEAKQDTGNTSAATTATQTATTATNTGTIAGAVSAPDATPPASAVQIGGVGQTAAPTAVTSGRAVRAWFSLIGAQMVGLLGANGSAIASITNGLPIVRAIPLIDKQLTLATAGKVIKASAGLCYGLVSYFNNTGGAIFFHIYNSTSTPTAGDRPDYFSASIASGTKSSLGFGITALGIGCPTGIVFVASSTQDTFTAIASTAVIYALQSE